jgi:hypothetical protein
MQEPSVEWITDLFRVSGKSVFSEGMISTTPQRKSLEHQKRQLRLSGLRAPVCSPSMLMPRVFRTHECAPSVPTTNFACTVSVSSSDSLARCFNTTYMCADPLVPYGDNPILVERRSPCLDGVCLWVSELRWILRESESDRNDRTFDLETFPFHGIQEYALYLPLVQGNLKWISRGRCCYIGDASYALQ